MGHLSFKTTFTKDQGTKCVWWHFSVMLCKDGVVFAAAGIQLPKVAQQLDYRVSSSSVLSGKFSIQEKNAYSLGVIHCLWCLRRICFQKLGLDALMVCLKIIRSHLVER
jgi:hypothetical protein